jgi:hypothetical protein
LILSIGCPTAIDDDRPGIDKRRAVRLRCWPCLPDTGGARGCDRAASEPCGRRGACRGNDQSGSQTRQPVRHAGWGWSVVREGARCGLPEHSLRRRLSARRRHRGRTLAATGPSLGTGPSKPPASVHCGRNPAGNPCSQRDRTPQRQASRPRLLEPTPRPCAPHRRQNASARRRRTGARHTAQIVVAVGF